MGEDRVYGAYHLLTYLPTYLPNPYPSCQRTHLMLVNFSWKKSHASDRPS